MKKILVAYATRAGSTVQVAEMIGQTLSATGVTVDVKPVKSVADLRDYAVVVGSAIRMGQWLPEAVDLVKKNQARRNQVSTAIFTVHLLNRDDSAESRQARHGHGCQNHASGCGCAECDARCREHGSVPPCVARGEVWKRRAFPCRLSWYHGYDRAQW
jgi:flavodoxin